ncbi:fatty acid desaturase 6 [Anolis carolinensis]|uniref:fatty acid desaturase 6 n=1 Tax=Anolis carolinensis TaxID=28377 RepID=UPI002F2B4E67
MEPWQQKQEEKEMLPKSGQEWYPEGSPEPTAERESQLGAGRASNPEVPKGSRRRRQRPSEEKEEGEGLSRASTQGPASPGEMALSKRRAEEAAAEAEAERSPPERRREAGSLMGELSQAVQEVVRSSSWWERHGLDGTLLALNFLSLPIGFLLLRSDNPFAFLCGVVILGVVHHAIAVKGSHLATHNALVESKSWGKLWAVFFIEVCSSFTAEQATYNHVKLHHAYTNIIGLGDSSTWKLPFLNRYVYMFIAPLAVPIITPFVAIGMLKEVEWKTATRTLCCILVGLYSHYWLLINISGFQSVWSAFSCMLVTRSLLVHPYIHVNIFQHIGLPMFSTDKKPKRIHMMTLGVLNLPRNPLLDWSFGHSIISCHIEHHLFPTLSDNMCLKIKPVVSQYLKEKKLPYNEDSYWSRLKLFLGKYEELMVHAPPITELVGIQ